MNINCPVFVPQYVRRCESFEYITNSPVRPFSTSPTTTIPGIQYFRYQQQHQQNTVYYYNYQPQYHPAPATIFDWIIQSQRQQIAFGSRYAVCRVGGGQMPCISNGTMSQRGSREQLMVSSGNEVSNAGSTVSTNSNNCKSSKGQNRNQSGSSGGNNNSGVSKRHHDNKSHTHPWLVTTLKGHTAEIRDMDFSSNGKYLASSAEDRTILLWACSQIEDSKNRKSFRINVEYDFGTKLAWSPDNKAIAIHKSLENCIEVYKIDKKDGWFINPTKGTTFPKVTDCDIIGFGIACTGRYMMTCTNKTDLFIWDLRGNVLDKIDTYLMNNYSGKISPCGRFIAACGFAPDCKIWEVKFSKTGEYQKTIRAFDLSGHSSGIYDLAFDQDTSHIATVSKDGTWKLFDTKIEYEKGQSPKCIKTGKYSKSYSPALIALSLNAEVLAIATGSNVELYSTLTGERDALIKNNEGGINLLKFDPLGKLLFTAADRYIRIYHNVTGYKTAIAITEKKLEANLTTATRERFEKLISEYQEFLKKFE